MMEKDDAVSTVIALMLVLGIIVTLIAIYSATYLPGLKQQSEIEHSREVADAFARFDSDIDHVVSGSHVVSDRTSTRFSEPFSLGGGDILLSPVRSSGSVTITQVPLVNVTVTNQTDAMMTGNASLVNVSYVPSFTAWEPQGYLWEYGFVAVTKDNVTVPQSSSYNNVSGARADSGEFLRSFIDMSRFGNEIVITLVNLTPPPPKEGGSFVTGSGRAVLKLNATIPEPDRIAGVTKLVCNDSVTPYLNLTTLNPSAGIKGHLETLCNDTIEDHPDDRYYFDELPQIHRHTLTFEPSVNVTLRIVNVEVGVW